MSLMKNAKKLTSSEQVGGQTHSIPILLSLRAAISSGGFKLENTSTKKLQINYETVEQQRRYQTLTMLNLRRLSRKHFTSCNEHWRYFFE